VGGHRPLAERQQGAGSRAYKVAGQGAETVKPRPPDGGQAAPKGQSWPSCTAASSPP